MAPHLKQDSTIKTCAALPVCLVFVVVATAEEELDPRCLGLDQLPLRS
jgi:hypothetical protein